MRPLAVLLALALCACGRQSRDWDIEIVQLTHGPMHHFFGYIGHVRNIPWNEDNRYFLALRTSFQDRMPQPGEPADVVLIDTQRHNAVIVLDRTRAWNFQQGTMFYWNPKAPHTQFFFNDRDPATHKVFTVLYDVARRKRIREYRFDDTPVGNGGVAQNGGWFLALNYGRMARLRPVTGYPGAHDFTAGALRPDNDGVFLVNADTGDKRLLVSFPQLADLIRPVRPDVDNKPLFINHSLWSRDDSRIYFYVRGDFDDPQTRLDIPCTIRPDGTDLRMHEHIGGHPEWESGSRLIGAKDGRQVIYDADRKQIVGTLGTPQIFPRPGGDIALSPDANWFVNGYSEGGRNFYTILRRRDSSWIRTQGFSRGPYTSGELRIDGAPAWNRTSDQLAFPALDPTDGTRQTFVLRIVPRTGLPGV
jgi:hypothetical protein